MTARIITGLILAAVVLWTVADGPFGVLAVLLGVAVGGALYEFLALPADLLKRSDRVLGVAAGAALLATVAFSPADLLTWPFVLVGEVVVLLLAVLACPHPIERAGPRAAVLVTGLAYVALLGSSAIAVARPEHGPEGRWVLLVIAAVTWLGDTAAFFGGKALGRHRLYPAVSPKKTWEGSVSGLAGSVLGALAVKWVFWAGADARDLVTFALIGGALGQGGDLVESVFKRSAGVKDSGGILPGHGGLLDRMDAFLFVAPFGWFWFYGDRFHS